MAILDKVQIEKRLAKEPWLAESLVITPKLAFHGALDTDSIDLRLGCHFLLPRLSASRHAHFCPDRSSSESLHVSMHVPLGRYLVVPSHQTVLGATLEYIKMPTDVSGEILTKSSVARTFTIIETAPWVHPGYRGCLTLEIANVSNTPLLLYPGRKIAQLVLMETNSTSDGEEVQLDDRYMGPIYPEAPKFNNPDEDLLEIGVKATWIIEEPKLKQSR